MQTAGRTQWLGVGHPKGDLVRHSLFFRPTQPLPKPPIFLYAPRICDVRPAPGRMQRIGGGGNGAAMQKEDMAGAMGAST